MSVVKSLWASIQGDPVFMRALNGWLTIFWIVMIPVPYSRDGSAASLTWRPCRFGRLFPAIGRRGRLRGSRWNRRRRRRSVSRRTYRATLWNASSRRWNAVGSLVRRRPTRLQRDSSLRWANVRMVTVTSPGQPSTRTGSDLDLGGDKQTPRRSGLRRTGLGDRSTMI